MKTSVDKDPFVLLLQLLPLALLLSDIAPILAAELLLHQLGNHLIASLPLNILLSPGCVTFTVFVIFASCWLMECCIFFVRSCLWIQIQAEEHIAVIVNHSLGTTCLSWDPIIEFRYCVLQLQSTIVFSTNEFNYCVPFPPSFSFLCFVVVFVVSFRFILLSCPLALLNCHILLWCFVVGCPCCVPLLCAPFIPICRAFLSFHPWCSAVTFSRH